jgi:hypothetical protein
VRAEGESSAAWCVQEGAAASHRKTCALACVHPAHPTRPTSKHQHCTITSSPSPSPPHPTPDQLASATRFARCDGEERWGRCLTVVGVWVARVQIQLMKPGTWIPVCWGVMCGAAASGNYHWFEAFPRDFLEVSLQSCWGSSLGDAKSSLGDAKSSLGGAKSSLGDAKSSLGDAKSSLGGAKSSLGDAKSSLGGAKSSLGGAKSSRWVTLRAH